MSRPSGARNQKRARPPTPHAPAGCGAATEAEALALAFGQTLAGIAREHPAYKPIRKECDSDVEFYAVIRRYQADGV